MSSQTIRRAFYLPRLMQLQGGLCFWPHCRRPLVVSEPCLTVPASATIEHLLPISWGGNNHPHNLAVSCYSCNNNRGDCIGGIWAVVILGNYILDSLAIFD